MTNAFLEALLHLCMVVTAAILVVFACRVALGRFAGASLVYASWSLVPITLAAFLIAKGLPTTPLSLSLPQAMQAPAILASSAESASRIGFDVAFFLLVLWLVGSAVTAAWFAMRQYRFVRSLGSLTRDETTASDTPIFRATNTDAGPLALGLFGARIVVPADFCERYSDAEQRLVLAHELAHIRRGDLYANAFATSLQVVFWFNPLVHWAVQRMRFDQELACDARVLGAARDLADQTTIYAAAVLKTALPTHASPFACHWQSRHPLNERILNMTAPKPRAALRRIAQTGLIALIAAGCYGALAFADRTSKPGEGQYRIDILYASFTFDAASNLTQRRNSFSMIQDAGKPAVFKTANDGGCEYTITITPVKDDMVQIDAPHVCDGKESRPKIVTQLGKMSSIGGSNIGEPGAAKTVHNVTMVVTR